MGVLTPIYGLALLLVLPIIVLYLMRPRQEKTIVASHFLWKKTLDSVNLERLDRRLIHNWLFYLQLATIIIGVLLLMQPFFNWMVVESKDAIIVVDRSISMATTSDDGSRLDQSKEAAIELINNLKGQSAISVYAFDEEMTLLYKGNGKNKGIEAIKQIEQGQLGTDKKLLASFLTSYETSVASSDVFVFSDRPLVDSNLIRYHLITDGVNTSRLETVGHRRSEEIDYLQIVLVNHLETPQTGDLIIYGNDTLIAIEPVSLEGLETKSLQIKSETLYDGYHVEWTGSDDFTLDNHYYVAIGQSATKKILLMGEKNRFLEEILTILPNVEVYKTELQGVTDGYDLYVFNGLLPEKLPEAGSLLFINPKGERSYLKMGGLHRKGQLAFMEEDELWRHVKRDFNVREVRTIETVIGKDVMTIGQEPIISKGAINGHPTVVIGFDLLASDFPIRVGFPVFMHNTGHYLLGHLGRVQYTGQVGQVLDVYSSPHADEYMLQGYEKKGQEIKNTYPLRVSVPESGFYILEAYRQKEKLASNLLAFNVQRQEIARIQSSESDYLALSEDNVLGQGSLKWMMAIMVILLLFIEWWVYNRDY